ncbi:MAG TPA: hypothetical protein VEJ87_14190, partial [Acidimicrobiales bacterium]|nr:hypothetical protein [Acidimicrobiales bacterium]
KARFTSTDITSSGDQEASNELGNLGISIPNAGGAASANGSFGPGSWSAEIYTLDTSSQISSMCAASKGITELKVAGSITISEDLQSFSTTPPASGAVGTPVSDSATAIAPTGGATPVGTVTFYWCGPSASSCAPSTGTSFGTGSLSGSGSTASANSSGTFTPSAGGTYCLAASWPGDSNYAAATSAPSSECFFVAPAPLIAGLSDYTAGTQYGATGVGNSGGGVVGYGYATECTGPVSYSIGYYPPRTCVEQGGETNGIGFWFSGDSRCLANGEPDSGSTFTWTADIPVTGDWQVSAFIPYWTQYNLGSVYDVSSDSGTTPVSVNQEAHPGVWLSLVSSAHFTAGNSYTVTLGPTDNYDDYCEYQPGDRMEWTWVGP